MDILDALTMPLGLPSYLVLDELHRGVSPASILAPEGSLLAEYRDARGYGYGWGNIIEARTGTSLAWHFAPVELWRGTDELRRAPGQTAAALIPELQPLVVAALRERLPLELVLVGCHPHSRRYPHVLFSLVLIEPRNEEKMRVWLSAVFLPGLLPEVIDRVRARLAEICRTNPASQRLPGPDP
jgi:hypothetical protein